MHSFIKDPNQNINYYATHKWKFDSRGRDDRNVICEICKITGFKSYADNGEIVIHNQWFHLLNLTCDEIIIKQIIE